jgi:YVTN family beta-propeller protein
VSIFISPDGRKLYAVGGLSNEVHAIDTAAAKLVKSNGAGEGP